MLDDRQRDHLAHAAVSAALASDLKEVTGRKSHYFLSGLHSDEVLLSFSPVAVAAARVDASLGVLHRHLADLAVNLDSGTKFQLLEAVDHLMKTR